MLRLLLKTDKCAEGGHETDAIARKIGDRCLFNECFSQSIKLADEFDDRRRTRLQAGEGSQARRDPPGGSRRG